jgi:subtilase family serine protease
VPVKDPTPVPQPTATNTPVPSPSPTASPTPDSKAPDFFVGGATLTDGGSTLHVTVGNQSTSSYTGALIVSAAGVTPGTLTLVFNVNIPANGSATVDFDITPAVTTEKTVVVKVDPDNAIKELHEDNNNASFPLKPAVESPKIVLSNIDPSGAAIAVSIKNNGGALTAANVTVRVTIGGSASEQTKSISLSKGQDSSFTVTKPGSGAGATVQVLIDGTVVATQTGVTIP